MTIIMIIVAVILGWLLLKMAAKIFWTVLLLIGLLYGGKLMFPNFIDNAYEWTIAHLPFLHG
jgi:hypothetical protein